MKKLSVDFFGGTARIERLFSGLPKRVTDRLVAGSYRQYLAPSVSLGYVTVRDVDGTFAERG
jgi:hypothetical protein